MKIYIHFDDVGFANGGMQSLTNFGQATSEMGHDVRVFNQEDDIRVEGFDWLFEDPASEIAFDIVPFETVDNDGPLVTVTLDSLLDDGALINDLAPSNIRFWDHDALLRYGYEETKTFVRDNLSKIAINNRELADFYSEFELETIVPLDNWFRREIFDPDPEVREPASIGYMSDGRRSSSAAHAVLSPLAGLSNRLRRWNTKYRRYEIYEIMQDRFPDREIVLCEGSLFEVGRKMKRSDFYLFYNAFKGKYPELTGEATGSSLWEAMASGCVCIARRHDGTEHLDGIIPLVDSVEEAFRLIENMSDERKEEIRRRGTDLIESRHRLNEAKRDAISDFLA